MDAEELVEAGKIDLVIVEDLARICRRNRAFDFCELCEDHEVRLVAINDHIDTSREDWRLNAHFATFRHQIYNKDTSERIKRSLRNRFTQGGVYQCEIAGYIKPLGCTTDREVTKDPAAEPIYDAWFTMLEGGASFSEVADWLEELKFKPGRFCRAKRWTGSMVRRVTFNPILKGLRLRNVKESKRINKTGRRRSAKAPPELLLERRCPHLAFIDPERYDRVIRILIERNEGYARGRRRNAPDSRSRVPKKRTVWPGQHLTCGICGRLYYWGGHGVKEHMMCAGAREYACWNSVSVDGYDAARRLSHAILAEIEKLPEFDGTLLARVKGRWEELHSGRNERVAAIGVAAMAWLRRLLAAQRLAGGSR